MKTIKKTKRRMTEKKQNTVKLVMRTISAPTPFNSPDIQPAPHLSARESDLEDIPELNLDDKEQKESETPSVSPRSGYFRIRFTPDNKENKSI